MKSADQKTSFPYSITSDGAVLLALDSYQCCLGFIPAWWQAYESFVC